MIVSSQNRLRIKYFNTNLPLSEFLPSWFLIFEILVLSVGPPPQNVPPWFFLTEYIVLVIHVPDIFLF